MVNAVGDRFDETYVPTALGRIRLQLGGFGDPVVLWPSLLMTGDMWYGVAAELADRHTLVLVDPPGQGGSQALTDYFTFDDCARCVADILDGLGLHRADFVGNSWGGMIGATFAADYPDRVGKAVLMNCTAEPAGVRHKLQFELLLRIAGWTGGIGGVLNRSVLKAFLGPTTLRHRPDVVEHVTAAARSVDVDSVSFAVRSVVPRRPDQRPLLGRITTPVLVVGGAEDTTFPPREALAMAAAIPGASVRILDGVAHLAALEDPVGVGVLIERFLAGDLPAPSECADDQTG